MLDNVDRDTIERIVTMANFAHEHETDVLDLKVQFDTPATGLKARLQAMPNGGQDALNEMGYKNMTIDEFFDISYIVTALFGDAISNGRNALAAIRKTR